jgi:hypothetical protein
VNIHSSRVANRRQWGCSQVAKASGNSAADIITAVAVLIGAITGLAKALLPVWLKKQRQKTK